MTKLTPCQLDRFERPLLRPLSVFRLVFFFGVVSILLMLQTHLRFRTRDMQIETFKLQERRSALRNHKRALISQVEELKRYETVRAYAENHLGLRECPPERAARAVVAIETVERWRRIESGFSEPGDCRPSSEDLLATVGGRMLSLSALATPEPLGLE